MRNGKRLGIVWLAGLLVPSCMPGHDITDKTLEEVVQRVEIGESFSVDDILSRIRLTLPAQNNAEVVRHEAEKTGSDATMDLVGVKASSIREWALYEDEYLSFRYPKLPGVQLEVVPLDNKGIRKFSNHAVPMDIFYCQRYRLRVKGNAFDLILLDQVPFFNDELLLMCCPIIRKKYFFLGGTLARFDLTEGDRPMQIQVLGSHSRIMIFPWLVSESVGVAIGASIRLKEPLMNRDGAARMVFSEYGFPGRLGFLEKGMTRDDVVKLLGGPWQESDRALYYFEKDKDGHGFTIRVDLANGIFNGFHPNWKVYGRRGSVEWVGSITGVHGLFRNRQEISPEDAWFIFDRFLVLGPHAGPREWEVLCSALHELCEAGMSDPRVLSVLKGRSVDNKLPQDEAALVIRCYQENSGEGVP
ncbi:MAG: hypothetical protein V1809_07425 [Planctomycetota bacterium]